MDNPNFLYGRTWMLKLLEAAEWNGISPVSFSQLHRFIFLANVLSPVSNLSMPESYTLKDMRGPYFPAAQWDVGRLVAIGLVDIFDSAPFTDKHGFWFKANYRITTKGINLVEKTNTHDFSEEVSSYLREFMKACNDLTQEELEKISEHDPHYVSKQDGDGVDFSELNGNVSKAAVVLLFPAERVVNPRESIHRYISYLKAVSGIEL